MLLCLGALSVLFTLAHGSLHLMRIDLSPKVGRNENEDVINIKAIFDEATGIDILYYVKELGSATFGAVLNMTNDCMLEQITTQLSQRGDAYLSVPVVTCEQFAAELDADAAFTKVFLDPIKHVIRVTVPVKGLNESAYIARVADFVEHIAWIYSQTGYEMTCFRETMDIPYKMFFFTNEPDNIAFEITEELKAAQNLIAELKYAYDLNRYTSQCIV